MKSAKLRRVSWLSWIVIVVGAIYFLAPLVGTFEYSLTALRDQYSFAAYERAFADPRFVQSFGYSMLLALATIVCSILLIVPTAYWVHLYVPQIRPLVEGITLLPFVVPAIVLVFGFIKIYSRPLEIMNIPLVPPLLSTIESTNIVLIAGYTVLSLPYMYRAVDNGLRAIDVRRLTEAAQSLGAGWGTILFRIILPNLRTALLSGALLTFAIVVGELTLATFLGIPAFGPYLQQLGQHKAYEPAALAIVSFLLTWVALVLISIVTRGNAGSAAGSH
ncbi:MAG: ABC transporter permease [Anaerolineae bacterium]|nr:ABC transporter permease [Anaerolineae bacterium]